MSRWPERTRSVVELALVFAVALACLLMLGGRDTFRPSDNNHFVHVADAWLSGRLAHDGRPPGYCDARARARGVCRRHGYDDWAVVWTLELRDGTSVRGFPCRTSACEAQRRHQGLESWLLLGGGTLQTRRGEIVRRTDTWYVSFPPGPAVLMVPWVALWKTRVWDPLVTAVLGALIPVVLLAFLQRERVGGWTGRLLAMAWVLGSPACFLAAHGRVWFTAQIAGALFLSLYLFAAWRCRRPALAGLCLGMAIACRPTLALAVVLFAGQWWRAGRSWRDLARFVGPLLVVGSVLMALNMARFSDPFEFGHRYLDIHWQARIQEVGLFSVEYLPRNLRCLLTLLPVSAPEMPWFRVSIHGMALWLSTPWILTGVLARRRYEGRPELWLSAALIAIPALLYQNSGQLQYTYRFAVDWLPPVILALGLGCVGRHRGVLAVLAVLVFAAIVVQTSGAYWFGRDPARLFVADPMGWPFEDEFLRTR